MSAEDTRPTPQLLFKQLCGITAASLVGTGCLTYFDLNQFHFITGMAPALFGVHITISLQNKSNPYQLTWKRLFKLISNPNKELALINKLNEEHKDGQA